LDFTEWIKSNKYDTVGTIPKSSIKIVKKANIDNL